MPSLGELLPHRPPMVLLDGFKEPSGSGEVEAHVDVTAASPFYEAELGGVPACVALEYMAQTMALCVGLYRRDKGLDPKLGFVLGSRRLETRIPAFRDGERYRVRATCTYHDEEFGSFDCDIRDSGDAVVASGRLTAFQPEGELTPEKLESFT